MHFSIRLITVYLCIWLPVLFGAHGAMAEEEKRKSNDYSMYSAEHRKLIKKKLAAIEKKELRLVREACKKTVEMQIDYEGWKPYLESIKDETPLNIGSIVSQCADSLLGIRNACRKYGEYVGDITRVIKVLRCIPGPEIKTSSPSFEHKRDLLLARFKWGTYNQETKTLRFIEMIPAPSGKKKRSKSSDDYSMYPLLHRKSVKDKLAAIKKKEQDWVLNSCKSEIRIRMNYSKWRPYLDSIKDKTPISIGSMLSQCADSFGGIRRVCDSGKDAAASVSKKIKVVSCSPGPDLKTSLPEFELKKGVLHVKLKWGTYNVDMETTKYLKTEL